MNNSRLLQKIHPEIFLKRRLAQQGRCDKRSPQQTRPLTLNTGTHQLINVNYRRINALRCLDHDQIGPFHRHLWHSIAFKTHATFRQ